MNRDFTNIKKLHKKPKQIILEKIVKKSISSGVNLDVSDPKISASKDESITTSEIACEYYGTTRCNTFKMFVKVYQKLHPEYFKDLFPESNLQTISSKDIIQAYQDQEGELSDSVMGIAINALQRIDMPFNLPTASIKESLYELGLHDPIHGPVIEDEGRFLHDPIIPDDKDPVYD
jgi:hypothetical protein